MSKHTPGPWKLLEVGETFKHLCPVDTEETSLLTVTDEGNSRLAAVYRVEDAHLIAAAPELLESLKEINQHLRDVVETQKNGDRNNWEGYYVPEFSKLSQKFDELIRKAGDAK